MPNYVFVNEAVAADVESMQTALAGIEKSVPRPDLEKAWAAYSADAGRVWATPPDTAEAIWACVEFYLKEA